MFVIIYNEYSEPSIEGYFVSESEAIEYCKIKNETIEEYEKEFINYSYDKIEKLQL